MATQSIDEQIAAIVTEAQNAVTMLKRTADLMSALAVERERLGKLKNEEHNHDKP